MKKYVLPSFITAIMYCVIGSEAHAQLVAKNAWVRTTVSQQKATGAFMQLQSATSVKVVEASSPLAGHVEIHSMEMQGDVMKMRAVKVLEIPAGKTVELKSGSFHVMLFDLKSQIKAGDIVPITFIVENEKNKRTNVFINATAKASAD